MAPLLSLLRPNVGFNSWQPPIRSHFRPSKSSLTTGGAGPRICMLRRRRLDKINLAELTSVQLHLLAPLLLCLALVLTVSGDDPLVVDIRLHPWLPAISRYEGWVVKWAFLGSLLGPMMASIVLIGPRQPTLVMLVPQVRLYPGAPVGGSPGGGEAQGYGSGGNGRVDQAKTHVLDPSAWNPLAPSSILILKKWLIERNSEWGRYLLIVVFKALVVFWTGAATVLPSATTSQSTAV